MEKSQLKIKIKRLLYIVVLLVIITILIFLFENRVNGNIKNIFDGIWFLFVTISTVGYGDAYPVTTIGRILTLLLILSTPVLLIQILSLVKDLFAGSLLPQFALILNSNKNWYIFDELNEKSLKLIVDINEKFGKDSIIIYKSIDKEYYLSGLYNLPKSKHLLYYDIHYSDTLNSKKNVKIFLTSANSESSNYITAKEIEETAQKANKQVDIYITSNYSYDFYSNSIHIVNQNKMITQVFLMNFSKKLSDEKILIIGNNKLTEYIFEALIVNNVYDENQKNEYYILTKDNNFKNYYRNIIRHLNDQEEFKDKVTILEDSYSDPNIIKAANIIILCDSDKYNLETLNYINKFYSNNAKIYIKNQYALNLYQINCETFGDVGNLFLYDNVVNERIYKNAKKLNEIYREKYGGPIWNELTPFKKESNVVTCNHIKMKKILIDKLSTDSLEDNYINKFNKLSDNDKYKLYKIEHERWCRFHYIYNWEYSKERNDENRKHNLLVPFNQLSDKEKEKNKEAYECIDSFIS